MIKIDYQIFTLGEIYSLIKDEEILYTKFPTFQNPENITNEYFYKDPLFLAVKLLPDGVWQDVGKNTFYSKLIGFFKSLSLKEKFNAKRIKICVAIIKEQENDNQKIDFR